MSKELVQGSLDNMIRDQFIRMLRRVERVPEYVCICISAREETALAGIPHLEHPRGTTRPL